MYNSWKVDLKDSIKALNCIKNSVLPRLIKGKIHTIEAQDNNVLILLDTLSGIDYIRENENGLQGIAARVQWGNNWNTFTIRKERHTGNKTEYQKRMEQIENGYFYPFFTLQAYFNNRVENRLLSIAVIKTKELYNFINKHPEKVITRKSDNFFYIVKWIDVLSLTKAITL